MKPGLGDMCFSEVCGPFPSGERDPLSLSLEEGAASKLFSFFSVGQE